MELALEPADGLTLTLWLYRHVTSLHFRHLERLERVHRGPFALVVQVDQHALVEVVDRGVLLAAKDDVWYGSCSPLCRSGRHRSCQSLCFSALNGGIWKDRRRRERRRKKNGEDERRHGTGSMVSGQHWIFSPLQWVREEERLFRIWATRSVENQQQQSYSIFKLMIHKPCTLLLICFTLGAAGLTAQKSTGSGRPDRERTKPTLR